MNASVDPMHASRAVATHNYLDSLVAERQEALVSALCSRFRSGKLTVEEAFGWVGALSELRGLRRQAAREVSEATILVSEEMN